eukprot:396454-Amphidinium_carterae.1
MAKLQFAHGTWCAAQLRKYAEVSQLRPLCQLCGQHGTMSHRVFHCPAFREQRRKYLTSEECRGLYGFATG